LILRLVEKKNDYKILYDYQEFIDFVIFIDFKRP